VAHHFFSAKNMGCGSSVQVDEKAAPGAKPAPAAAAASSTSAKPGGAGNTNAETVVSGFSLKRTAGEAVAEAARQVNDALKGVKPSFIVAYFTDDHDGQALATAIENA
jgi:hypothetical protein